MGVLFTDGSNSTRTGKCGWSVIGRLSCRECCRLDVPSGGASMCVSCGGFGFHEVKKCGFGDGTNQLAELIALVYAMRLARTDEPTLIVSDSEYSINAVTTYRKRWEASQYHATNGKVISYLELIKYAHRLHDEKPMIRFKHVRGHTGVEGNEEADKLAGLARAVAEGREPAEKLGDMLVVGF